MARQHYRGTGQGHHEITPNENDPIFPEWKHLSRFEKVCWLWLDGNRQLRQDIKKVVTFEKLISDFDYFEKQIIDPVGINISESLWRKNTQKPQNVTENFTLPKWPEWDKDLTTSFNRICGEEMEIYGYY